jgi:hypothetical protein
MLKMNTPVHGRYPGAVLLDRTPAMPGLVVTLQGLKLNFNAVQEDHQPLAMH